MEDTHKTKEQLINELESLRRQVANLERQNAEQKKLEYELRETEEKFATAFLNHPVPMAITAVKDGRYIDVNESYAESIGLRREEIIGQNSVSCGLITPEQRALGVKEFREKGRFKNMEMLVTTKRGEKRWGLLNAVKIKFKDEECFLVVVIDMTDRKNAEEALCESEERYLNFFQNAVVGATQVTPDGRILRANNTAAKIFGYESVEEINDVRAELYVDPERRKEGEKLLAKYGYVENFEAECWHKDGHKIWISYNAKIVRDAHGKITHYDSTHQDITERKQLEKNLQKKEQLLKKAQSMARMGHWSSNLKAGNMQWSDELYKLLGYLPGEIEPTADWYKKHVHPDDQERLLKAISSTIEHKVPYEIEFKYIKKDGAIGFAYAKGDIVCDVDGSPAVFDGIFQDITDRKRAEEAIAKSEEQYRLMFENAIEGMYQSTVDGRYLSVNPAFARMFGYATPEEMINSVTDIAAQVYKYPEEREKLKEILMQGGVIKNYEVERLRKDGQAVWQLLNAHFVRDSSDNILMAEGAVIDITERKRAEGLLQESEERFRQLTEASFEGIVIHHQGVILDVNRAALNMFGYNIGELIGKALIDFVQPESVDMLLDKLAQGMKGIDLQYELVGLKKNKSTFPIEVLARSIHYKGLDARVVAIRDITERKKNELALQQAENKFRKIFYGSPIPMAISSISDGMFIEVNESLLSTMGYSRDEIIGKTALELGVYVNNQKRNQIVEILAKEGSLRNFDVEFRTKTGKIICSQYSADYLYLSDGKYLLASLVDITDKKRAEEILQKMNEELETRVAERTADLVVSNDKLVQEINERKKIEEDLRSKERDLDEKTINLKEMNTALNVLLKRKDVDRSEIENNIMTNTREIISPYLEKLRATKVDSSQTNLIDIIEKSMEELISPFVKNLKKQYTNLTSREMEIAYLIREGKTSKEIASVLGMTLATVDFHRLNIRRKLGIKNQEVNLRTILTSFTDYEE